MAIDLTPEQRETGQANFRAVSEGLNRRGFMKSAVAAAGGLTVGASAAYFGYKSFEGKPVKAALIGCGDEGGVLLGEHDPKFIQFIAGCDIRPTNKTRILKGDPKVPLRKGFAVKYDEGYAKDIGEKHFYTDYKEMLAKEKDIEAVVIALPLHLHAAVSVECMKAGKHVLCEKLMAWNVHQCKQMIAAAKRYNRILSIGHQRHYSMLYAQALEVVNAGVLGDIKHIRALWHRNNSWPYEPDLKSLPLAKEVKPPAYRDGWYPPIYADDYNALNGQVEKYGYKNVEELVRWRIANPTGGGLMAELGSHQLDACSIFLGKVKPLSVTGVGLKSFYRPGENERDSDDHVFVTYEFPGAKHPNAGKGGSDKDDVVVVTYSSVNTNSFEAYGECLMGSRGTMVVESESTVMLYTEKDPRKKSKGGARDMTVSVAGGAAPVLDTSSTWGPAGAGNAGATGGVQASSAASVVSRGYTEEMADFAYCVRQWDEKKSYAKNGDGKYEQRLPRCHGEVAMADAILALVANKSMRERKRIEFNKDWFDADKMGNEHLPDSETIDQERVKVDL